MATQENLTISNPSFAAESAGFVFVQEKEKKKQQEELAHLATVLKLVEKELVEAKSGTGLGTVNANAEEKVKGQRTLAHNDLGNVSGSEGSSNSSFEDTMVQMVLALQLLQVQIGQFGRDKAKLNSDISEAQIHLAQQNLQEIQTELKKIAGEEQKQKTVDFWKKVGAILLSIVSPIFIPVTIKIFKDIPLDDAKEQAKMINELASTLQANGLSPKSAEILARLLLAGILCSLSQKKDDKKQQEELAHLVTILALVEEEIVEAKSGAGLGVVNANAEEKVKGQRTLANNDTGNVGGSEGSSFEDAMAQMTLALQLLQVKIAQFGNDKANLDYNISQAQVTLAQNNLKNLQDQLNKIAAEQKKQKTEEFWMKFAEVLATVIVDIIAVVTLNPVLFIMTTTMFALSMSGALSKLTDVIASSLKADGLSPEVAEILASVIVTLIVIVATAVVPTGGLEAAASGGERVAEAGEQAANRVIQVLKTVYSKVKSVLKLLNIFRKLPVKANMIIMNMMQTLSETGFPKALADCIAESKNMSEEDKLKLENDLQIAFAVVTGLVSLGAGTAMSESMGNAVKEVDGATAFGRFMTRLREWAQTSDFLKVANYAQVGAMLTQTAAEAASGVSLITQGQLEKNLADCNANLELLRVTQDMNTAQTSEDQKHEADVMKQQSTGNQSISQLMKGEAAFAQLFTQYSSV